MIKKCVGCGAVMQSDNKDLEGYVPSEKLETSTICERCFRIKNYGDYKNIVKDNNSFININTMWREKCHYKTNS